MARLLEALRVSLLYRRLALGNFDIRKSFAEKKYRGAPIEQFPGRSQRTLNSAELEDEEGESP